MTQDVFRILKFLTEEFQSSKRTVAILSGAFKPPHKGHLRMVEHYARIADEVLIIISSPKNEKSFRRSRSGKVITPEISKDIWDIYIKRSRLNNVRIIISEIPSPIKACLKYALNDLKDCNLIIGMSKKDNNLNKFDFIKRDFKQYFEERNITLLDIEENSVDPFKSGEKTISASDVRSNSDNLNIISKMLPDNLSEIDLKTIFDLIN